MRAVDERNIAIVAAVAEGEPLTHVAARYGISRQRIGQILNPDRQSARMRIKIDLRRGRISRPSACEKCGSVVDLGAHHPDYEQPLSVIWLCRLCHEVADAEDGTRRNGERALVEYRPRALGDEETRCFIKRMKETRREQGLTIKDLAERIGIQRQQLSQIENRSPVNLTYAIADRLAEALGVDPASLIAAEGKRG